MENFAIEFRRGELFDDQLMYGTINIYSSSFIKLASFEFDLEEICTQRRKMEEFSTLSRSNKLEIFKKFVESISSKEDNILYFLQKNGEICIEKKNNTLTFRVSSTVSLCEFSIRIDNQVKIVFNSMLC